MFYLIENGSLFAPKALGAQSILIVNDRILKIGPIDATALDRLGIEGQIIDASDCMVLPGLIDPHAHLIGAGGEQGFPTRTTGIQIEEIVQAGVTTVVGLLGTDTTTRHIASLYAQASQLTQQGITAYTYTGGFRVPAVTMMGSVMDDLVLLDRVIGVGEIAIADYRSTEPTVHELARLVSEAILGGMVGGKAGITHFHTGDGKAKLRLLHEMLDQHEIPAEYLYPAHIARSTALIDDAIALAKRGAFVDTDTIDEKLADHIKYYRDHGGPLEQLTVSSDAHTPGGTHSKFFSQLISCVRDNGMLLEDILPLYTTNTARVLKLNNKARLHPGMDADLVIVSSDSWEIKHVLAKGHPIVYEGRFNPQLDTQRNQ
jgi:beta-aspartyl-dipeptidase (metallo-type)